MTHTTPGGVGSAELSELDTRILTVLLTGGSRTASDLADQPPLAGVQIDAVRYACVNLYRAGLLSVPSYPGVYRITTYGRDRLAAARTAETDAGALLMRRLALLSLAIDDYAAGTGNLVHVRGLLERAVVQAEKVTGRTKP